MSSHTSLSAAFVASPVINQQPFPVKGPETSPSWTSTQTQQRIFRDWDRFGNPPLCYATSTPLASSRLLCSLELSSIRARVARRRLAAFPTVDGCDDSGILHT
jgi:hypothetical protein